jgi:hypothetical protein
VLGVFQTIHTLFSIETLYRGEHPYNVFLRLYYNIN